MRSVAIPAAVVLIGAGLALASALILGDAAARREVERTLGTPHGLAGLFGLNALSTAALIFPVPGIALTAVAATIAPPVVVGIVAGAGQALGELTGYAVGRGGHELAHARLSSSRIADCMRRHGTSAVFVLALVPNPVFDVAGVLAGTLRMPVLRFVAAVGAGKVLRNVTIALLVAHGSELLGA